MRRLLLRHRLRVTPIAVPNSGRRPLTASAPILAVASSGLRNRWRDYGRYLLYRVTAVLHAIPTPVATTVASTAIPTTVALPDFGLTIADRIGFAIAITRATVFDTAAMRFRPACIAIGTAAIITFLVMTPTSIMAVTIAMMFAIPFVTLATPIATMMIVHLVPFAATVEDVKSIARIPVILIPATAIAYVVETAAIVAIIIAVERAVGIAAIAVVIIAIAIVIIAKADTCIIIAGRKTHSRRPQCCDPRGQFCTHSRHKTYPNMYPSALFPSWPIRRHGPS